MEGLVTGVIVSFVADFWLWGWRPDGSFVTCWLEVVRLLAGGFTAYIWRRARPGDAYCKPVSFIHILLLL